MSALAPQIVRAGSRRALRVARRFLPPPSTWHLTLPGFDRLLELRWARMIRRARVYSPQEHAAAMADPARRGAAIEVPVPCAICDGSRLQELLHVYDHRRKKPRWNYHVVRCARCGFLFRHPGIRPERLATSTPPVATPSSWPASTPTSASGATR